jgi:hypothetical protein
VPSVDAEVAAYGGAVEDVLPELGQSSELIVAVFGEGKALLDLLTRWRQWREERGDPARLQAQRLIAAFEAYGVRRQQIVRLMPESLALPSPLMSSAERLKDKISPALLDWASEYLALSRAWLDGVDPQPHVLIEGYKDTRAHERWLRGRIEAAPNVQRFITVWKADRGPVNFDSVGPLCIVYEEVGAGLDGSHFSRYWLLSRDWPLGHPPPVECMVVLSSVARSLGVMMSGRIKPLRWLEQLEMGAVFVPEVVRLGGEAWYPEDAVFGGGAGIVGQRAK